MSRASNPPTQVRGSSESSPSYVLGETPVRRRLVLIPSDQQKLLDLPESWATAHADRSPNVPRHVLENLQKWHARQLRATRTDSLRPIGVSQDPSDEDQREASQAEHHSDSVWTESSPSHKFPPLRHQNIESIEEENIENVEEENIESEEEDEQEFLTQVPLEPSPKPTASPASAASPTPRRRSLYYLPSSAPEEEDELEVQVPNTVDDNALEVSKPIGLISGTPPSAQAQTVPCTLTQQSEEPKVQSGRKPEQGPQPRPYRRVPELYQPPKAKPRQSHLHYEASNLRHGQADVEKSLPAKFTSSPNVPCTIQDEARRTISPNKRARRDATPTRESYIHPEDLTYSTSPPARPPSSAHQRSSAPLQPVRPASPTPQPRLPPAVMQADSAPQGPFIRFASTYPSYGGSVGDFVIACIYIQLQQRRIRTSLYDDFIRAWHEGYVTYVAECDEAEPPARAMNAIDWYNDIDDDPLYTSRVVTKQNLQATLDAYPDELRAARQVLDLTPATAPAVSSARTAPPTDRVAPVPSSTPAPAGRGLLAESVGGPDPGPSSPRLPSPRPLSVASPGPPAPARRPTSPGDWELPAAVPNSSARRPSPAHQPTSPGDLELPAAVPSSSARRPSPAHQPTGSGDRGLAAATPSSPARPPSAAVSPPREPSSSPLHASARSLTDAHKRKPSVELGSTPKKRATSAGAPPAAPSSSTAPPATAKKKKKKKKAEAVDDDRPFLRFVQRRKALSCAASSSAAPTATGASTAGGG
ncbi:hypothetical protein GGS23DRAFT_595565 [Durotheca rogersii]|uniref:uncharacterized protein n=1 Tax=Durotheca rogersii TaxID=419775 RepID=UPI00221EC32F|nr:uncharacterized protein GGS23DRAFT_595565 [Durotheca rogersii]KAI5864873.1 hypothetical protein GGS23DRAFT_595565 [Durotheca rogersii]